MENKCIAITGSTGFIGGHIISEFENFNIIKITREDFSNINDILVKKIEKADVVINLAGASILKRWTPKNMKEIYDSRIVTTGRIVEAINLTGKEIHLLSASAIGIYDEQNRHTEESNQYSEGFIYEVIKNWENIVMKGELKKCKWTIMRIGIVIAKNGGLVKNVKPLFKVGLGGRIGNGKQAMSFIHIYDLLNAIRFIIEKKIGGIVNMTVPNPVTNKQFTRVIARMMRRPALMPVPVLALRLVFGDGASIIHSGQWVIPERLMKEGFEYKFPDIETALRDIIVD